ncbi:MAG: alpha/beta hydrolase fold domain-containing protein [Bacteroidetes bacterium]|nr:alpha/beta hydrolase fold domain-containing protein [Bacteroidota bacterium]
MSTNSNLIEENRALYDSIGNLYPVADGVEIWEETIVNIKCHWLQPKGAKTDELVIYVHGGGYAIGSFKSHKAMVTHFAKGLNRTILFIEYSLAPEHPYPKGLNDIVSIYKWAVQKYPSHSLYLFGDSAGGGLIISAAFTLSKTTMTQPKAIALISPWYNLSTNNPSAENRQSLDQILNKEMVLNFAYAYAGDNLSVADPSKLNFTIFPPVIVGVGTNEILFDDAIHFYDMVYKIQPKSQLKIYGGEGHVLTQMNIFSRSSQDLILNINNFFNTIGNE